MEIDTTMATTKRKELTPETDDASPASKRQKTTLEQKGDITGQPLPEEKNQLYFVVIQIPFKKDKIPPNIKSPEHDGITCVRLAASKSQDSIIEQELKRFTEQFTSATKGVAKEITNIDDYKIYDTHMDFEKVQVNLSQITIPRSHYEEVIKPLLFSDKSLYLVVEWNSPQFTCSVPHHKMEFISIAEGSPEEQKDEQGRAKAIEQYKVQERKNWRSNFSDQIQATAVSKEEMKEYFLTAVLTDELTYHSDNCSADGMAGVASTRVAGGEAK